MYIKSQLKAIKGFPDLPRSQSWAGSFAKILAPRTALCTRTNYCLSFSRPVHTPRTADIRPVRRCSRRNLPLASVMAPKTLRLKSDIFRVVPNTVNYDAWRYWTMLFLAAVPPPPVTTPTQLILTTVVGIVQQYV